ncbi:Werner Syndrome-like exonuclease [Rhynchospora pubera]|uniref:Werner Syndrome-like exonuclease n=1 Tax=Rhynchospora pubera TaxID=906938 RepID=A0AAV8GM70_9POAL|nr:Werner Syndrome-like exonuclease [Rhynchospora pubera]
MGIVYNPADSTFNVSFNNYTIKTTVTACSSVASNWINDILRIHSHQNPIVVGLDIEWCPNGFYGTTGENPAALLQLCVEDRCLIFQLIHCDYMPFEFIYFFSNDRLNFVGVGITSDFKKLEKDYGLKVRSCVNELGDLAAERTGWELMKKWSLQKLLLELREMQLEKPKSICLSNWSNRLLTPAQIEYAALDAFASFDLGWYLIFEDFF